MNTASGLFHNCLEFTALLEQSSLSITAGKFTMKMFYKIASWSLSYFKNIGINFTNSFKQECFGELSNLNLRVSNTLAYYTKALTVDKTLCATTSKSVSTEVLGVNLFTFCKLEGFKETAKKIYNYVAFEFSTTAYIKQQVIKLIQLQDLASLFI